MALSSAFPLRALRVLGVTVALVFASTFGFVASQVSADDCGGSAQVDETERALALIALTSDTPSPYINGRGQLAYELTEHATALNAQASQTPQVDETERALALIALTSDTGFVDQSQNQQSIALSESRLVQNAIVAVELAP
jgi:hypothetical protein